MRTAFSKTAAVRIALAIFVAVSGVAFATQARAADLSASIIDPASISVQSQGGGPINQWDWARASFEFDTTGKAYPAVGDTFGITLPPEFATVNNLTFPLQRPDGTVLGSCSASGGAATQVTCTFSDAILNADGTPRYQNLSGTVWVDMQAMTTTESQTVEFGTVSGTVEVDLPGDGGIGPSQPSYPDDVEKVGWFTNNDRNEIVWQIFLPGNKIDNTIELTISDTLSGNHSINESPRLQRLTDPATDAWEDVPGATVVPNSTNTGFDMSVPAGTLNSTDYYRVLYQTIPADSEVGSTYGNSATVSGETLEPVTVVRAVNGGGDIDGPGYGGLSVAKQPIAGDAAAIVPADAEFTVLATYEVDGAATSKELTVTAGGDAVSLHGVPTGTVVTLQETQLPLIDGVSWGTPQFAPCTEGGDGIEAHADGTATVTVGDQSTACLQLTNTASVQPKPSIDIVKKDAAGNDADTASDAVTLPTGATDLVFTITNNGTEPLLDVAVSDAVTAGSGTVTDLNCTFPDQSAGLSWQGPFEVGASFICTAKLAGVTSNAPHTDVATVSGIGQFSGITVSDDNPYHAVTPAAPVVPTPKAPAPAALAVTGSDLSGTAPWAAGLLLAGAGALYFGRRHKV